MAKLKDIELIPGEFYVLNDVEVASYIKNHRSMSGAIGYKFQTNDGVILLTRAKVLSLIKPNKTSLKNKPNAH